MVSVKVGDEIMIVGDHPEWGGPIYRVEDHNGIITFVPIGHGDYAGLEGEEGPAGEP